MNAAEAPPRSRWAMTPARWLLVAVAVYFVVAFALSWLRALELQTTTWDQGLYQQALWTTAHGRAFYETADVETGGYGSLLEVHSAFLLYLIVPLYAAVPSEATMLAVQAAVVALAAVPLYYLARDITGSARLALLTGAVYLCWTPTLSSNLYDFHPEAFLPLEIFALTLVWNRGRYLLGFGVAVVAFLTFEFTPLIVGALAVFALLPERSPFLDGRPSGAAIRGWLRSTLGSTRGRASLGLLAASVAAYAILLLVRVDLLPSIVGSTPLPSPATGYLIGATPSALGLAAGNLTHGFGTKATYWLLILGLLAFVPLLAPRALVMTVPWFAFTFFSTNVNYVTLGFQYGLIAGSTVLVAFAFALPRAQQMLSLGARSDTPVERSVESVPSVRRTRVGRGAVLAAVILVLAVNVALTPANPALQNTGLGAAYRLSYDPPPGAAQVRTLAAMIPAGATVLASDDLFPLVANDAQAYSFLWVADSHLYLPFTLADPPTYVFLAEDRTGAVISWIDQALYDPAIYGVRGVVWSSPVGTVLLFEAGYSGPATSLGSAPDASGAFYGPSLAAGPFGVVATDRNASYPSVVESVPGETGTVWLGPSLSLPAGHYTVSVSVRVASLAGFPTPNASAPAVWIGAYAWAQATFFGWTYPYAALASSGFATVAFNVTLPSPTIEFDVQGELLDSGVQVTLNDVTVTGP